MEYERVGVAPEFGDNERHAFRHQAGEERYIAREPIQLRQQDAAFGCLVGSKCVGELRPAIQCIGALAGLRLDELSDNPEVLGFGEALDGGPLRLDPESRALRLPKSMGYDLKTGEPKSAGSEKRPFRERREVDSPHSGF